MASTSNRANNSTSRSGSTGRCKEGLASGKVAPARLDDAARRVLRAMFAHGLFDDRPAPGGAIDFEAHAAIAQRQAEEAIVLLENRRDRCRSRPA